MRYTNAVVEYNHKYYQEHRLQIIASTTAWTNEHRKQHNIYQKRSAKKYRTKIRELVFQRFGRKCVWCGSIENLELDHVYPLVRNYNDTISEWIGALLFPQKYFQILCRTCNMWKRHSKEE